MYKRYEVVVVGAGPAGSATAHYLARQGLDVLLLDKFDFPRDKTCGDGLPPRALAILEELGLLEELLPVGYCSSQLQITSPNGYTVVADILPHAGLPGYTMIVPRRTLDNLLRERAMACGAAFLSPVTVTGIETNGREVIFSGEQGRHKTRFRAQMAVLATGANLSLLKRLGLLTKAPQPMLAARAYFDGIDSMDGRVHFRFDGLPSPGSGWIFPLSGETANVGAGFLPSRSHQHAMPATAREAFERFITSSPMQKMLAGARRAGPVKGYPLRTDFVNAPTFGERLLLVGEAVGLVNPLTGDGIDYALESGKLAAEHLGRMFAAGDFSRSQLTSYDRLLRHHFQQLFIFCNRMRWGLTHPFIFNRLARAADRDPGLRAAILATVLRSQQPSAGMVLRALLKIALNQASL